MVSVLVEALLKQSALIDATILVVVDTPKGRKWAARNHLRQDYLDGKLASLSGESEILVEDPPIEDSKGEEDMGETEPIMESYCEEVEDEENGEKVGEKKSATTNPNRMKGNH